MSSTTWGRVAVRGTWRPAYTTEDGTLYVAPHPHTPWRRATDAEAATWQARRPEHQRTAGRVWDDALYGAAAG